VLERSGSPRADPISPQRQSLFPLGPPNNPGVEANIGALLAGWSAAGQPAILVRHNSAKPGSPLTPGTPGNAFATVLHGVELALTFGKRVNSAFHGEILGYGVTVALDATRTFDLAGRHRAQRRRTHPTHRNKRTCTAAACPGSRRRTTSVRNCHPDGSCVLSLPIPVGRRAASGRPGAGRARPRPTTNARSGWTAGCRTTS